jgi:uncharacterized membrane protein YhhN
MNILLIVACASLSSLLIAEWNGHWPLRSMSKTLCSACFCAAGFMTLQDPNSFWVLMCLGFVASFVGDVLLLWANKKTFLFGLASFLVAHLFYAASFVVFGVQADLAVQLTGILAIGGLGVSRWLWPFIKGVMRPAVVAYIAAIIVMVAMAVATGEVMLGAAAVAFMVSDLAVARERFIKSSAWNKLWGLPLYFAAQWGFVWALLDA